MRGLTRSAHVALFALKCSDTGGIDIRRTITAHWECVQITPKLMTAHGEILQSQGSHNGHKGDPIEDQEICNRIS